MDKPDVFTKFDITQHLETNEGIANYLNALLEEGDEQSFMAGLGHVASAPGMAQAALLPIAIEPGDNQHAFGIVVPDLPGCFSAGDTLEEARTNAWEAITSYLKALIDEGMDIPMCRPLAEHQANPEYAGRSWEVIVIADSRTEGEFLGGVLRKISPFPDFMADGRGDQQQSGHGRT